MGLSAANQAPKVLVVEDEYLISHDIGEAILEFGFDLVGYARSASEALSIASSRHPDVVVTDLNLAAGSNGEAVVELLSSVGPMRYLILSGDRAACDAFACRFPDWPILDKPVRLPVLKETLLALLDHRCPKRAV